VGDDDPNREHLVIDPSIAVVALGSLGMAFFLQFNNRVLLNSTLIAAKADKAFAIVETEFARPTPCSQAQRF
jgi:hypothetical protein